MKDGQQPRRGRPEGNPDTARRVLSIARRLFSEHGFDATSIRKVATEAEVDPAVVHYHFGTKTQLFRAAIGTDSPAGVVPPPPVAQRDDHERAECIAGHFLATWESMAAREKLLALLRSAGTHDESAEVLRTFINGPLWTVHGKPDGRTSELENSLAAAQLLGVALLRYVVKVESLAQLPVAALVARLSPVISYHLAAGHTQHPEGERDHGDAPQGQLSETIGRKA